MVQELCLEARNTMVKKHTLLELANYYDTEMTKTQLHEAII